MRPIPTPLEEKRQDTPSYRPKPRSPPEGSAWPWRLRKSVNALTTSLALLLSKVEGSSAAPTTPSSIWRLSNLPPVFPRGTPKILRTKVPIKRYGTQSTIPYQSMEIGKKVEGHPHEPDTLGTHAPNGQHQGRHDVGQGHRRHDETKLVAPTLYHARKKSQRRLVHPRHRPAVHALGAGVDEQPFPHPLQTVGPRRTLHDRGIRPPGLSGGKVREGKGNREKRSEKTSAHPGTSETSHPIPTHRAVPVKTRAAVDRGRGGPPGSAWPWRLTNSVNSPMAHQ